MKKLLPIALCLSIMSISHMSYGMDETSYYAGFNSCRDTGFMDFYALLELPRDATNDQIKKAYRKMSLKYHSDKGGTGDIQQKLNAAKEILLDNGLKVRTKYDQMLEIYDNLSFESESENYTDVSKKDTYWKLFLNSFKNNFTSIFHTKRSEIYEKQIFFESKIQTNVWYLTEIMQSIFTPEKINENPEQFLKYLYRVYIRNDWGKFSLDTLRSDPVLLEKCKQVRINGFSAIGAAIISQYNDNINEIDRIDKKIGLINALIDLGFEPTENDKHLAYLELLERTPSFEEEKKLLYLGFNDEQSILFTLPINNIRSIARFLTPPLISDDDRLNYISSKIIKLRPLSHMISVGFMYCKYINIFFNNSNKD